ncbi:PBP1A family penicillin-binding protein, partial [Bacteriovoracaceae bacterium]|nr:PBP1A family penicillin-binding protein [Bacteriovoracaceae bacterium]
LNDYSPPLMSRIYDREGKLLLEIGNEKRTLVDMENVPQKVIDCFVSAEDDNFFEHSGVDYSGILRAALANLKAGRVVQGGSTITQQVAKSLLLSSERSFTRKIKDLLLARKIEKQFSKNEILYLYLNQMYFGGGYYGIVEAFQGYFGKKLNEVTSAECALVAGLLVAPGRYSPYINPGRAKKRQLYVLERLKKRKKITIEEYEQAVLEDMPILNRKFAKVEAGYFTDWILQRLFREVGKDEFLTGGYEVYTTLDLELNNRSEKELFDGLRALDKRQGYKGSPEFLSEEDISVFLHEQLVELYKSNEESFTFKADGTVEHSFNVTVENIKERLIGIKDKIAEQPKEIKRYYFPGNDEEIDSINLIDKSKTHKAVVLGVNDRLEYIFVSLYGLLGVIPQEEFSWVHKRELSTDPIYHGALKNPSKVFKEGDVVEVRLLKDKMNLFSAINKNLKKRLRKKKWYKKINRESFVRLSLEQHPEVEGAVISVSARTGEILSMVGGKDFKESKFNRAIQSLRQPGSAVKPFIYAAALENGYNPASTLYDTPQALGGVDDFLSWKPKNYDGKFKGTITLRKALETSRNIPTIKLVQEIGITKMIEFFRRMNINGKLPEDLSISLGSFGISLIDLVTAYSIFPNAGKIQDYKGISKIVNRYKDEVSLKKLKEEDAKEESLKIEDKVSEKLTAAETDPKKITLEKEERVNPFTQYLKDNYVYDRRLAYLMTNLCKGIISHGTGRATRDLSSYIGGKTGTTNNYVDAWFIGFSNKTITGVWTGFDDNKTLGWPETGSKAALPVWKGVMELALKKYGEYDFYAPSGIVNVAINRDSGKHATPSDTNVLLESFVEGYGPDSNGLDKEDATTIEESIMDSDDYYYNQ